jgi:O-antigen/teichoic acid export membrane protein
VNVLARNAGWVLAGQCASIGLQAAYFVLLTRLLGSSQYGVYIAIVALVSIVNQYSTLGAGFILLRRVSADPSRFSLYWGNVLLTTVLVSPFVVGMLVGIGHHLLHGASMLPIALIAAGECVFTPLVSNCSQAFQAFEEMRRTALLSFVTNLIRALLALVLFLSLHKITLEEWAAGSVSVSIISALLAVSAVTYYHGRPTLHPKLILRHAGEGIAFAVSCSTTSIYNDIDKVMLGNRGLNVANGIYSVAYRVLSFATMPVTAVYAAAFPRFFRQGEQGISATVTLANRLLKKTTWLSIAISIALFACAPLIPHIVGMDFSQSAAALRWLCLIPVFRNFQWSAGDALAGAGYQHVRLGSQLAAAALNLGVNLFMIPRYSWVGAAWASLITDGSLALMSWGLLLYLSLREKMRQEFPAAALSGGQG